MLSKSLIYKVLVLFSAALIFNQVACSQAFEPNDTGDNGFTDPSYDPPVYDPPTSYEDPTPNDPNYPRCDILSNTGNCYRNVYRGDAGSSRFPVYGPSGQRVSFNQLEIINGYMNLQVFVNGSRVSYSADNNLVQPSRSGNEVIIEFCTY